jgi:tetraacyldisaccharide 4'-kinase
MQTPQFWQNNNIISTLLLPFSWLYLLLFLLKQLFNKPSIIKTPSICIGNLIAGGSGKTPVALAIGKILQQQQINFAYISRGYKRKTKNHCFFLANKADKTVGDEPLLLNQLAPVAVGNNRLISYSLLTQNFTNCELIIFDDGLQSNTIKYDLRLLVIDGNILFGNGLFLPAGPLRQPISNGINNCDAVIVINDSPRLQQILQHYRAPIIYADLLAKNWQQFVNKKLFAFCGLGYPDKFFQLLLKYNLNLAHRKIFADHHNYTTEELQQILQISAKNNLVPVTTKKDWVKFPLAIQKQIFYLDIELQFNNDLTNLIIKTIAKKINTTNIL